MRVMVSSVTAPIPLSGVPIHSNGINDLVRPAVRRTGGGACYSSHAKTMVNNIQGFITEDIAENFNVIPDKAITVIEETGEKQ